MKRYRIRYRDPDPGCPVFSYIVRAYDREHAEERFYETNDGDDWQLVSITELKEN